jgi:hypothetical protein
MRNKNDISDILNGEEGRETVGNLFFQCEFQ